MARAEGVEPSVAASEAGRAPARPVLARVVGNEPTITVSRTAPARLSSPRLLADHVGVEPTSEGLEASLCPREWPIVWRKAEESNPTRLLRTQFSRLVAGPFPLHHLPWR